MANWSDCYRAANRLMDMVCAMYHPGDEKARTVAPVSTWAEIIADEVGVPHPNRLDADDLPKLTIKTAEEYRQAQAQAEGETEAEKDAAAAAFIEAKVKPMIEDKIANPKKYTSKIPAVYVDLLVSDADDLATRIARMLNPLGFTVEKTHDGGGMYAVLAVRWGVPERRFKK